MAGGGVRPPPGEEVDLGEIEEDEGPLDEIEDGAEAEGDEAGGPDGADGEEDGEPERRPQETRDVDARQPRKTAYQRAYERAQREFDGRFRDLEQRIAQRPQAAPDPAAQAAAVEAERQHVAALPYDEQARYWAGKVEQQGRQAFQQMEARLTDRADKTAWDATVRGDPRRARLATEVERLVAQERAGGNFGLNRENAYYYVLGKSIEERAQRETPRQRAAAGRRVAQQRTRPGNGSGDALRPSGRQGDDSYEAALARSRNVPL